MCPACDMHARKIKAVILQYSLQIRRVRSCGAKVEKMEEKRESAAKRRRIKGEKVCCTLLLLIMYLFGVAEASF